MCKKYPILRLLIIGDILTAMKNILFDLDGTLTNPQKGILNCIKYALDKLNVPIPPESSLLKYIGPSLWESFKEMLDTDSEEEANEGVMLYRERFSTVGKFENTPYSGIQETLGTLKAKGYTLYIYVHPNPRYSPKK